MAMRIAQIFNRKTAPSNVPSGPKAWSYRGGILVSTSTAMKVSALHRGVTYLSSQMAKLPMNIKDKDRKIVEGDRVAFLIQTRPNREMNAQKFWASMMVNAILQGNAFAEIERDIFGRPIAIWPLESQRVEPYRDERGTFYWKVSGNEFSSQTTVLMDPRDILHIPNLFVVDGLMGQGLVAWAKDTLSISLGADRMARNLFQNGGMPSGVLEHPNKLEDETAKRLRDSWQTDNGGESSGGVAVLEEGMKFKPIIMDPQLLQMLDSRKFGVEEIARFLNVPPTKLYVTAAATFNNVENANLEVAVDTLDAWCRVFEAEIDCKLLSDNYGGKYCDIDLAAVFRGDMKTRAEYANKMMQSGAMTPNEIREMEGRAGYDGGDEFYIATNNFTPVSRMNEVIDAQIKKGQPATPTETPEQKAQRDVAQALVDRLSKRP